MEASRLSSKASTIWVVAVSSEAAEAGITGSGVRKAVSGSCCGENSLRNVRAVRIRKNAEQAVGSDTCNCDRHDLADTPGWCHHRYRLKIWGFADQLPSMPSRLLEQHVDGMADEAGVECALLPGDEGLQALQALGFFLARNLHHLGRRRAGARRIHEGVSTGKTDVLDERQRVAKILFAFAREADDEIRAEGEIRTRRAQAGDDVAIM